MLDLNLGLTKTYNLFHDRDLDEDKVAAALAKSGGKGGAADCSARITRLRELHAEMDQAVLKAYGWVDIKLEHGFYELDFLPENDRVRYTICDKARREVLERLLELNHRRHGEEARNGAATPEAAQSEDSKISEAAETSRKSQRNDLFAAEEEPVFGPERLDLDQIEWPCEIRKLFSSRGERDREMAIKELASVLGYQRVREGLRERLDSALSLAVRRGILENRDGELSLLNRSISEYQLDFLKEQFLASLEGHAWKEREDAIRDFARWLGYSRTSEQIDENARSIINGLIRQGKIEAEGTRVRRG